MTYSHYDLLVTIITIYIGALADRYGGIAVLYINIFKSDLMSAIQTIIII